MRGELKVMPTHGDWHDFTVSVLKCKEIRKIYRDHSHCPKILKLYCIILLLCFYISFTLHNSLVVKGYNMVSNERQIKKGVGQQY